MARDTRKTKAKTKTALDYATCDDNDDDAVGLADSYQAYNDPTEPIICDDGRRCAK